MSVFNCCCDHGFQFVVVQGTPDTPWSGSGAGKLYLQSGQFSSTLKTSQTISVGIQGICWDGVNTPWADGGFPDKLVLQSGQYTSTVKDSLDVDAVTSGAAIPRSITSDGNTPWSSGDTSQVEGNSVLYLQSGQFTSTIKDSLSVDDTLGTRERNPVGLATDGIDSPWLNFESSNTDFFLQSGQFDSTIKDSLKALGKNLADIEWDGTNILAGGSNKLHLYSGKFTSTVKTSVNVSAIDNVQGISSNALGSRS